MQKRNTTYNLVEDQSGRTFLTEYAPGRRDRLIKTVKARDPLSAHMKAFGKLPDDLDPGIKDLVILLNEIPGVITLGSCAGHKKNGCAYVLLAFESIGALSTFTDLLEFVTSEAWHIDPDEPEPILDVALELDLRSHVARPRILFELVLTEFPRHRGHRCSPPGSVALALFTMELRKRAAARFRSVRANARRP